MNQEFYDTNITTVRYQIINAKRDKEKLLEDEVDVVTDSLTPEAFTAWKIAEYTRAHPQEKDMKFLRVTYQILSTTPREEPQYDKEDSKALREIADNLRHGVKTYPAKNPGKKSANPPKPGD